MSGAISEGEGLAGHGRAWPEQRLEGSSWSLSGTSVERTGGRAEKDVRATQSESQLWKKGLGDCLGLFATGGLGSGGWGVPSEVGQRQLLSHSLPQQGARFGALGPIDPPHLTRSFGAWLSVSTLRLSNKLLAWSGVLSGRR